MTIKHPRGTWKPVVEYELGCSSGHGVKLRDGRAWCDVCAVFVDSPVPTGRTRGRQFVLEVRGGKTFDRYPMPEPFR